MSKEVLLLVDVLAKEKNLDKETVFQCLEKALAIATKKGFEDDSPEIDVVIDRNTGKYKTIRKWIVTTDVDFYDDDKELSLSDINENPEKFGDAQVGDTIEEEIENIDLGRVSAQTARNIIAQRIKDAEREQVLHEYLSRNRGMVIGKVRKFERGNVIVDCGRVEAIIMKNDLIPREVLQPGDQVKGYLDKKNLIIKSGRMLISRSSNDFLQKLLENNIPEVASGRVEIVNIAREPGTRAKVSVFTLDPRIDAKGSCIGFRNQRIDSVTKELAGEKIDIIDFNTNLAQYTINALSPAEIDSIVVDEEKKVIEVIVDDEKLGTAIGENGINVRLAGKLVGMVVNIFGKTEAETKHHDDRGNLIKLFTTNLDVEDEISEILVDNDFSTLDEVAYVDIHELINIEDFDEDIAKELQERARNKLLSKTLINKDVMDSLALDLNSIVKFSKDVLLQLVEAGIKTINDFADLSGDELMEIINIDIETANKLILKAREASGYFNE
ncbi:MAG: transcription termination factor NusA [Proteobacteria bacterium]|jgi:N utilization substance protein A|nr:transcription termination factor NusA [Pseudomonadota bacterium]